MPKYSIIVPAYNAEDRIDKVLGSIRSQEFIDYELIVICDSCTDRTEEIAREKYNAITSIENFHNDGLSRSKGLDLATGDWVLFLDDDDWWLHEYCLTMIDSGIEVIKNTHDILQFGFIWKGKGYYGSSTKHLNDLKLPIVYSNVWTKCFKRSFIGDTRFPEVHSVSDSKFMERLAEKEPKVAFLDYPIYYYNYLRVGSISEQDKDKSNAAEDINRKKELDWSL